MKAKTLILFLTLAGLLPMVAQAQVNYAISGNTAYVTSSSSASGNVVISNTYNGYPVTSIGEGAFENSILKNVTIGTNIVSIGDFAFYYCASLTNVVVPNTVTNIGRQAFYYCPALTNVLIGTNVMSIGHDAFYGCSLTNVVIPGSVTSLGDGAFAGCNNLTNITFLGDAPVVAGGNIVFYGDPAKAVYYYYGTSGWSLDFGGLPTVELNIPPLTYIAENGFVTITGYTGTNGTVTIDGVINGYPITRIGGFYNCTNLTSITIGDSVTNILYYTFDNCQNLTNVIIGTNVTSIGNNSFIFCFSLKSITFMGNAPTLDAASFYYDPGTVYYYYGTSGWSATYGGLPTVELAWTPQIVGGAEVQSNNFSFTLIGTNGMSAVVEASTNLVSWQPIWTNTLSGASATFTDSQWTNYPARFYRAR